MQLRPPSHVRRMRSVPILAAFVAIAFPCIAPCSPPAARATARGTRRSRHEQFARVAMDLDAWPTQHHPLAGRVGRVVAAGSDSSQRRPTVGNHLFAHLSRKAGLRFSGRRTVQYSRSLDQYCDTCGIQWRQVTLWPRPLEPSAVLAEMPAAQLFEKNFSARNRETRFV